MIKTDWTDEQLAPFRAVLLSHGFVDVPDSRLNVFYLRRELPNGVLGCFARNYSGAILRLGEDYENSIVLLDNPKEPETLDRVVALAVKFLADLHQIVPVEA